MNRGEVWWVNFGPSVGGEIQKSRPAVIVSNDSANRGLNRVQVVPLTSNVDKLYPGEVLVDVQGKQHRALASQLSTVSKQRLRNKMGQLSAADVAAVGEAIKVQLALT